MFANISETGELGDLRVTSLGEPRFPSPLLKPNDFYVHDSERILVYSRQQVQKSYRREGKDIPSFELAGPRQKIFFDPSNCK